jgi:hypothetical protein
MRCINRTSRSLALLYLCIGFSTVAHCAETAASGNTPKTYQLAPSHNPELRLSSYASTEETINAANIALKLRLNEVELYNKEIELKHMRLRAIIERGINEDRINERLYSRQLYYHPIILLTVLTLVGTSTALVVAQFIKWGKSSSITESTVEIGRDGLKLKSPFIGLLMLIVSYGFFYLYILEVYRIHPPTKDESGKAPSEISSEQ